MKQIYKFTILCSIIGSVLTILGFWYYNMLTIDNLWNLILSLYIENIFYIFIPLCINDIHLNN